MAKKSFIAVIIAVLILVITVSLYLPGYLEKPQFFLYDIQTKLFRADKIPPKNVKIVLVDDASLKALEGVAGRWPWPRAIWADLLEFLSLGGARAVLFDILFTERADPAGDQAFAEATAASHNVYHSMIINRETADDDARNNGDIDLPMASDVVDRFSIKSLSGAVPATTGSVNNDFALPIDGLRSSAKSIGVVEFAPDVDHVFRKTRPLREYQGNFFPVLGLAPFIDENASVSISSGSIRINDRVLPLDYDGNYYINMFPLDKVRPYSISGIFQSLQKIRQGEIENLLVNPEEFRDAIVFVGASAVGAADLKATPLASSTPGVALHFALASNYIQNDFLRPPDRRMTLLSIFFGACLTPWIVFYSNRFLFRAFFPLLMLIAYTGYSFYAFRSNLVIDAVPFIIATISSSFLSFAYLTFTEASEKRRVSQLFTQYVSKDVLNEVLHNYKEYLKTSGGQKVELTILFSDIRGFTTFSENTPPERIVEMLNTHFSKMAGIILKHDGTLDKYIGDAIMAFWGAPVITKDHAEKAVLAAREMLAALEDVNRMLKERGFEIDLKIGIGINTGIATIGNIGSEQKLNYTVVGDTVNLASRLESITKEYKSPLIFSEYTYEKVKDKIPCRMLGNVKVKGREQPVTIYTAE